MLFQCFALSFQRLSATLLVSESSLPQFQLRRRLLAGSFARFSSSAILSRASRHLSCGWVSTIRWDSHTIPTNVARKENGLAIRCLTNAAVILTWVIVSTANTILCRRCFTISPCARRLNPKLLRFNQHQPGTKSSPLQRIKLSKATGESLFNLSFPRTCAPASLKHLPPQHPHSELVY